jgi:hypothetical protein
VTAVQELGLAVLELPFTVADVIAEAAGEEVRNP